MNKIDNNKENEEKIVAFANAIFGVLIFILVLCFIGMITGCSHNPMAVVNGKRFVIGNMQFGEISYTSGLIIFDVSRENSSWELEVSDTDGVTSEGGSVQEVKKIKRTLGKQVSGYLVELSKDNPEAAKEYLKQGNGGEEQ